MRFLINEVLDYPAHYAGLSNGGEATPDMVDAILEGAATLVRRGPRADQPFRRPGGLPLRGRRSHHPGRLQGSLPPVRRRRLAGAFVSDGIRWPGAADIAQPVQDRDDGRRQLVVQHVSGTEPGLHQYPFALRHRGTEIALSAITRQRRVDRHHVPDRAAVRHRSGADQDQGRAATRRQLQAHRHQDVHLGRRARSGREYRAHRPRPPAGRTGRHTRYFAVRRAEVSGRRRRLCRPTQ